MADIPTWWMKGAWFDVCSCDVPCPCSFAQAPTNNRCEGVLVYHVREGAYGDVVLSGLNVIVIATFEGNAWAKENPVSIGIFMDERANDAQREALQRVFSGQAGGWMSIFAELVGEVRGLEFVPIEVEVAPDLAQWRAEIPDRVTAFAEALSGPTTPPGARVQLHNAPGSEVGPGQIMTWGKAVENEVDAFGHKWSWSGQSSKRHRHVNLSEANEKPLAVDLRLLCRLAGTRLLPPEHEGLGPVGSIFGGTHAVTSGWACW